MRGKAEVVPKRVCMPGVCHPAADGAPCVSAGAAAVAAVAGKIRVDEKFGPCVNIHNMKNPPKNPSLPLLVRDSPLHMPRPARLAATRRRGDAARGSARVRAAGSRLLTTQRVMLFRAAAALRFRRV